MAYRGHESIAVKSHAALIAGLSRPKVSFRQRNLYCQFALDQLAADELVALETKAMKIGDYILAGHLLRDVDAFGLSKLGSMGSSVSSVENMCTWPSIATHPLLCNSRAQR